MCVCVCTYDNQVGESMHINQAGGATLVEAYDVVCINVIRWWVSVKICFMVEVLTLLGQIAYVLRGWLTKLLMKKGTYC